MIIKHTDDALYIFNPAPLTWSMAAEHAANAYSVVDSSGQSITGALASINDEDEQALVSSWVLEMASTQENRPIVQDGGGISYVWLGGSDSTKEGYWTWQDYSPFSYTNWGTGNLWQGSGQNSEPDDFEGQDGLAMGLENWPYGFSTGDGLGNAGQWNDIDTSNEIPSLIKFNGDITRVISSGSGVAFDMDGHAGITAKILGAVFGPESINNEYYAGVGLSILDRGTSYEDLIELALSARLGEKAQDPQAVIELLYSNVTGQTPTTAAVAYFAGLLENGDQSLTSLGMLASETELNANNIGLTGLAETGLTYELI